MERAILELRDWMAKHNIRDDGLEIVFRGWQAREIEMAVKHNLTPALAYDAYRRGRGDVELYGIALSFERAKKD